MSATEHAFSCRRCSCYWLIALCLLALHANAIAQAPVITDADMTRARQGQPIVTEQQIEEARRKHDGVYVPDSDVAPSTLNTDALPQPATNSALNLEALARGYANQANVRAAQGLSQGPSLLIFISLSMPQPTLQRLLDQAARARASVRLRGFAQGSLRTTVAQVQALIGSRQIAVEIDPESFDRFAITRVPSFVLVRDGTRPAPCANGTCAPPADFLRVEGDVSLDYALEHMRGTTPALRTDAESFLARLRAKP